MLPQKKIVTLVGDLLHWLLMRGGITAEVTDGIR